MADQTENAYQKQASLSVGGRKSKQYKMKGGKVRSTFHRSAPAAAAPPSSLRGRGAGRDGGWWEGGAEGHEETTAVLCQSYSSAGRAPLGGGCR